MQDNNREMHKIDEALYFVIEEKNNQVELTDMESNTFQEILMLTFRSEILELKLLTSKKKIRKDAEAEEKEVLFKISV
jgi:preprotein translocase subunit SecA